MHVHKSIQDYSREFELQYKRKATTTPKSFLDFIITYKKQTRDFRAIMDKNIQRFEGGLMTLKQANESTKALNKELEVKNKIVTEKKEACNKLLNDINKNTAIIDK